MIDDPTGVTTVRRDWVGEEKAAPGMGRELKRLASRARRRWLRTIGYTLVCSALVVGAAARKPRSYASRVAFRVTEGSIESKTQPRTNGKLRDYVASVVFSNSHLLSVIKEHDLYPSLMARDPTIAVESMRDDIDVEVWRNEFAVKTAEDDPARTARVAVTFHGNNAKVVFETVSHLGRLIRESEQHSRIAQAESALRLADDQVEQSHQLVESRKRAIVEHELARSRAKAPEEGLRLVIEQRGLEKSLPRAEKLLAEAETRREQTYMRLQLEKHALGIKWEMIDPGRIEAPGLSKRALLTWLGIIAFLLALPLCGIGVGTFDPHVYDLEDVRRLGLPTVGAVRHFDGDNAGALVDRLRDEGRARLTRS
jgi:hypothetical protein